jgi:hypothetical protein
MSRLARRLRAASLRARLIALAVAVLAVSLAGAAVWEWADSGPASTPAQAGPGTAFLGTTTCADWREAGVHRRLVIVRMLGVAATQPDPENVGATLAEGEAYALFQRVCSGGAPDSTPALRELQPRRVVSLGEHRGGSLTRSQESPWVSCVETHGPSTVIL